MLIQEPRRKTGLIFVLNAQDDELIRLQEEMNDLNWEDESQHERLVIINGDSQPLRRKNYTQKVELLPFLPEYWLSIFFHL